MAREVRDHPANEDDADRHRHERRVPGFVAIAVALVAVAVLAYLAAHGAHR